MRYLLVLGLCLACAAPASASQSSNPSNAQTIERLKQEALLQEQDAEMMSRPEGWDEAKCAFSIGWAIGTTLLAPAKLLKIRQLIHEAGGVWKAAKMFISAKSWDEKMAVFGKANIWLVSEFFGINSIRENC